MKRGITYSILGKVIISRVSLTSYLTVLSLSYYSSIVNLCTLTSVLLKSSFTSGTFKKQKMNDATKAIPANSINKDDSFAPLSNTAAAIRFPAICPP